MVEIFHWNGRGLFRSESETAVINAVVEAEARRGFYRMAQRHCKSVALAIGSLCGKTDL